MCRLFKHGLAAAFLFVHIDKKAKADNEMTFI